MSRLPSLATSIASAVLLAGTLTSTVAHAESQAELAEKLNEEGKELMYANRYAEATLKFQQAVARVGEPKYYFNLCVSQTNEGDLDRAYGNCTAAKNNAAPELSTKVDKMITKIEDLAKSQGKKLNIGGATGPISPDNPSQPPGPGPGPGPSGDHPMTAPPIRYAAPSQNLARATTPDNQYTWTVGVDALIGGGQIGQTNAYGSAAYGLRFKGDYLADPIHRLGVQAYLQVQHLDHGTNDSFNVQQLDIIDLGIAGYKHFCLGGTPRLCVTPLVGVHLSLMSPANQSDNEGSQLFNYAAVGGRGELALSYAFGPRYENVLSVMAGVNVYSKVLSGPGGATDTFTIMDAGLDKGGALGYFSIGYTRRFNTPLGSSPFITLE